MKTRAAAFLMLFSLVCPASRARADESLPKVATPVLKMTGLAAPAFRQPKIITPALQMTGVAVQSFRQPKITTPGLEMTGLAVQALRQPKVITPALQMTGLAAQSFRQPKIATPSLEMTGLAAQTFRQPKITTPVLEMTGLASGESPLETPERDAARAPTHTLPEDELSAPPGRYTFLVPVELEKMPDEADRFQVAVAVYSGSQILGTETAEKNIRGGSFENTVSVSVAPAAYPSKKALTYKVSLVICDAGTCVSPLDSGSRSWAGSAPGSFPKVSHEGSLTSQVEIEVPPLSMTGNKKYDEAAQSPSAPKTDADISFRGGFDRAEVSAGKYNPKLSSTPEKTGRDELRS